MDTLLFSIILCQVELHRCRQYQLSLFSFFNHMVQLFNQLPSIIISSQPEMESSRTPVASRTSSRTDFEALGLEASSPRKLHCPWLEDSTIFWTVEILLESPRNFAENLWSFFVFFKWKLPEKNFWRPFSPEKNFDDLLLRLLEKSFWKHFFWRALASVSLVLGLERICPWPWLRNFFVFLALVSSLVSSTPPLFVTQHYVSTYFFLWM